MSNKARKVTTGFTGLDQVLDHLHIGDNVVWKVDNIEDYRTMTQSFAAAALTENRRLVYFRFGQHEPLLAEDSGVVVHAIDPRLGFESFTTQIHAIITKEGKEVFYVFDCLSELLSAWATDHMIANFFRVTCPYLFELDTVAYFALIRGNHALRTIARIRETTQVLVDIFTWEGDLYLQPLKVWERHSPTMFLPHRQVEESFVPLANSREATQLMSAMRQASRTSGSRQIDHWHHLFLQAEELAEQPDDEARSRMVRHLCRHMIGREERILELACRYFSLEDLLTIKSRLLGTGFVGGKAVGMLLARNILLHDESHYWVPFLEAHDSFHVGSNVYYSYMVHNGWWRLFMEQKTEDGYFEAAKELSEKMLSGEFPERLRESFKEMLEYFGQYPIIVRSSSLLEDSFGSAFAGKYDSFFVANQGPLEQRLENFEHAVRRIFSSAMSEDALAYRRQRGLDQQDEQMALLVQRVSGSYHSHYYFPDLAGVGVSYNTFVWDKEMDPQAGMLRLVMGLGTRAVDRVEGDYPRIVALDTPNKLPHSGLGDTRKYAQRDIDLINLESNELETHSIYQLIKDGVELDMPRYAIQDKEAMQRQVERGRKKEPLWLVTFDRLLGEGGFTKILQRLLKTLEETYRYPVDIEYTVNFAEDNTPRINVLQCRPLQTKGMRKKVEMPTDLSDEQVLFRSEGNFMGGNIALPLRWVIWVEPESYASLSLNDKHETARIVGRLTKRIADRENAPTMLLGPGRWGTSTPSLGVPVTFAELSNVSVIGEVAFSSGDLMPELSYGSHFFQDLVEGDIFYLALFPESGGGTLNRKVLEELPNKFEALMPSSSRFKQTIKVFAFLGQDLQLRSDVVDQRLLCYSESGF